MGPRKIVSGLLGLHRLDDCRGIVCSDARRLIHLFGTQREYPAYALGFGDGVSADISDIPYRERIAFERESLLRFSGCVDVEIFGERQVGSFRIESERQCLSFYGIG